MSEALDSWTWLAIGGIVAGFFLVPFAMLLYDHRRQQHIQSRTLPSTAQPAEHGRRVHDYR